MLLATGSTALFLFWEIAILLAATRIALAASRGAKSPAEEFFAVVVSAAMLIEGIAASAISFAHANSIPGYTAVALLCLVCSARRAVVAELLKRLRGLSLWQFGITAAVLLAAAIPLFFLTLKPIDESDSANYLHFLLEWRAGRSTPYNFSTYYVAFGTSRFLPSLVLSRTDWFFGFVALEPVLLLGLGLYLVAAEFEIPPRLRLWSVAAAVALEHLWGSHSGVGTLKADSLHAAGVVLLALVLVRAARSADCFSPLLFAFALVFATEKYTGVFLAILATGALLWMRVPIVRMLPAAALALVTTGHYYLHSLRLWGNPFYPFTVRFGPFELPGTGDLSDTSILANRHDPRLWKLLFLPAHWLSPAGLLFPGVLALMLIAALWVLLTGVRRRPPAFWLAGLLLAGWLLFARTFWGAGPQPHTLEFLEADLSTLRYVEGFLGLGEIFLVWLLWKRGMPQSILLLLAALNGASRLWLLYRQPNLHLFMPALWIGAAVLAGLAALRFAAYALVAIELALVIMAPAITDRNRALWFPEWKPIYQAFADLEPTTVFLFENSATGYSALHFALCGPYLKHDVRTSPDMSDAGQAHYLVRLRSAAETLPATPEALPPGYRSVLRARYGTVSERTSSRQWDADEVDAWYLPPGKIAAAELPVDSGAAKEVAHRLQFGELVFVPPLTVLRLEKNETESLEPAEGSAMRLLNSGGLVNGRPRGLLYRYRAGTWRRDRAPLPLPEPPAISIERGSFQIERLADDQGPYLRIRAQNDARWLVLVTALPTLAEAEPFTAFATARGPAGASTTFWLWTRNEVSDYDSPASGEWHEFRQWRRARHTAPDDHLAIGRKYVRAGDSFDVREQGVIPGIEP
jgi:hypothetical protein